MTYSTTANNHYNALKFKMSFGFAGAFLVVMAFLAFSVIYQANRMITNKVLELTHDLSLQATAAIDSVIESTESMMNVLFLPVNPTANGEMPDADTVFMSRLQAIQNSRDFAVVYRDGRIIGSLTDESIAALGKPLYTVLSSTVNNYENSRGWLTADDLSSRQIYYLRKINEDSLAIASVNVSDIANCIYNSNLSNGLVLRFIAPNGLILFSTDTMENGMTIAFNEIGLLFSRLGQAQIVNKQLTVVDQCKNGWLVTIMADTDYILKEKNALISFILVVFFVCLSLVFVFCIVFSLHLIMPIETLVRRLSDQCIRDADTKLYLKEHFGEEVKQIIESQVEDKYALIQLDIDNFQQMHEMRGNSFCSRLIKELADAMLATFPEESIFGRIDNDRFMVFVTLPGDSFQTIHQLCLSVQDSFRERVERAENATGVSVSAGVVLVPEHGTDFDLLCELSDRAVFAIKKNGRNGYHIYNPEDDVDMWK